MQGLKQIVVQDTPGQTKELVFGICLRCGEEVGKGIGQYHCPKCHSTDEKHWRQNSKPIAAAKIRKITGRKVKYQCPNCKKTYDTPTACCFTDYDPTRAAPEDLGNGWWKAWGCMGCGKTYLQETKNGECCPDQRIIIGRWAPDEQHMKKKLYGVMKKWR